MFLDIPIYCSNCAKRSSINIVCAPIDAASLMTINYKPGQLDLQATGLLFTIHVEQLDKRFIANNDTASTILHNAFESLN